MRSLKTILHAAGELKRVSDHDENHIALIVMLTVNIPKFLSNDISIFKSITSDIF